MKIVEHDTEFGRDLLESLQEVRDHLDGKLALPGRVVAPMTAEQVKAIRKRVAKSTKAFERRFRVPARTVEGWEQGRRIDIAAAVLMTVIAKDPEAVERALAEDQDAA
ncbi:MAG: transcriptional regulator [Pseudomonadota bacterium]